MAAPSTLCLRVLVVWTKHRLLQHIALQRHGKPCVHAWGLSFVIILIGD